MLMFRNCSSMACAMDGAEVMPLGLSQACSLISAVWEQARMLKPKSVHLVAIWSVKCRLRPTPKLLGGFEGEGKSCHDCCVLHM